MADIADGGSVSVQGSGGKKYLLKNNGGVYSCTCPAWNFQSLPIALRTCKHLKAYRGAAVEEARVIAAADAAPVRNVSETSAVSVASPTEAECSPVAAPRLLLAHKWEPGMEISGWWVSEKLDGVRAWWDGENFISRQGNCFLAPDWFVEGLPKVPLDGELWGGRRNFQSTVSITRRQDRGENWDQLLYIVFDAPALDESFEERLQYLIELFASSRPRYGAVARHQRCPDEAFLRRELARVERLGGEGLMLRQPGSLYVAGRSQTLLKVKSFYDAEARVTAHVPGTGRHQGRMGALRVELPDKTEFLLGTGFSDAQRETPPAIGAIVTFRYQELTNAGVPRFPSYVGERTDLRWEQLKWPPAGTGVSTVCAGSAENPVVDLLAVSAGVASSAVACSQDEEDIQPVHLRLEYNGSRSVRFWEVRQEQNLLYITYGREGRPAKQDGPLCFASPAQAARHALREAQAKRDKGYQQPGSVHGQPVVPAASSFENGTRRYFEFRGGRTTRFWEIALCGECVELRYGKTGTEGRAETRRFASAADAVVEAEKLVAQKTAKGYVEGGVDRSGEQEQTAGSGPRRRFEQLLVENPDDEISWLVYGDWLQMQGDPRGQLIALFCAGHEQEALRFIDSNRERFLGPIADYVDEGVLQLQWAKGFIRHAGLRVDYEAAQQNIDAGVVLRKLMHHPSSDFIDGITLGLIYSDEVNYQDAIDVLVEAGRRPSLRSLVIGDFIIGDDTEISWTHLGNCGQLWSLYPRLEKVVLQSGSMRLGEIHLPSLKEFEVRTVGLDRHCVDSFSRAHWPQIESLSLWVGASEYGAIDDVTALQQMLAAQNMPELRHLGLLNCEFTDAICEFIGESPVAGQLQTLDLSMGTMTDEGAFALARQRQCFPKLQLLNVDGNFLSGAGIKALSQFCAQVSVLDQEDGDEWGTYVSVGE